MKKISLNSEILVTCCFFIACLQRMNIVRANQTKISAFYFYFCIVNSMDIRARGAYVRNDKIRF